MSTDDGEIEEENLDRAHEAIPRSPPNRGLEKKIFLAGDDDSKYTEEPLVTDEELSMLGIGKYAFTDLSAKPAIANVKKKPVSMPSTIIKAETAAGSKVSIVSTPASPLVQTGPLHPQTNKSTVPCDHIPALLWRGGPIWKIPFNGRGSPEHRVVVLKRASFPGLYSKRVQAVSADGQLLSMDFNSYICFPPTLLWFTGDGKSESLHNARELILYEGTKLVEGHNTAAFWKLVSRDKPVPKPEFCFSVVTSTRTLDLAAESVQEANEWKRALKSIISTFVDGGDNSDAPNISHPPPPSMPLPPPGVQAPPPPPSGAPPPAVSMPKPPELSASELSKTKKDALKRKMFEAAHRDDVKALREALLAGVPVNLMEPTTADTPLMIACRNGNADMVQLCLQYGAKNDPHPDFGQTALHVAVEASQIESARALLEAAALTNADVIVTNLTDPHGQTVLHLAASKPKPEMLELLLRHGSDPNRADDVGLTPIHIASGLGNHAALAVLLDQGGDASIDAADIENNTPLHHSASNGHIACVRLLLESAANAQARNKAGQTPYNLASTRGHQPIGLLLLEYQQQSWAPPVSGKTAYSPQVPAKHTTIKREYSDFSLDGSEDSNISIDIATSPQRGRRSNSYEASSRFTPVLQRKVSDESLPRPHTASPSLSASKVGASSGKDVSRNPLSNSSREGESRSVVANLNYGPHSARERSSSALFDGMQVTYPTTSPIKSTQRNPLVMTPESGSSSIVYSPDPNRTKARTYNTRRSQGGGFAEPLSEFDLYLIQGFEDSASPIKDSSFISEDADESLEYSGRKAYAATPERETFHSKTFIDYDNSYERSEHNIDEPLDRQDYDQDEVDDYATAGYLPEQVPFDDLQHYEQTDEAYDQNPEPASLETFEYEYESWDVYMTDEGYTYYLNSVTSHSQWDDPRDYGFIPPSYYDNQAAAEGEYTEEFAVGSGDNAFEAKAESSPPRDRRSPGRSPSGTPDKSKKTRHSPARSIIPLNKADDSSSDSSEDDIMATIRIKSTSRTGKDSITPPTRFSINGSARSEDKAHPVSSSKPVSDDINSMMDADWDADAPDAAHVASDWDSESASKQSAKSKPVTFVRPPPLSMAKAAPLPPPSEGFQRPPPIPANTSTVTFSTEPTPDQMTVQELMADSVLAKYAKMKNIGIPSESIAVRMRLEGVDESLIEKLLNAKGTTPRRSPAKREKLSPTPKSALSQATPAPITALLAADGKDSTESNFGVRKLNWDKSVWDQTPSSVVARDIIEDREEFDKLFGSSDSSSIALGSKATIPSKLQSRLPEVIDRKRAQNIIIGLLPLKTLGAPHRIFKAICSLDNLSGSLRVDNLEAMVSLMPTESELTLIDSMSSSSHPSEEFLCQASEYYPQLPRRLQCFITSENFHGSCEASVAQCLQLSEVCKQILGSEKLAKFLQKMVIIDGMLKESKERSSSTMNLMAPPLSPKERASGFSLNALLKMINMKGTDKKTSVLDYVVKSIRDKGDDGLLELTEDLQFVDQAFEMSGLVIERGAKDLLLQVDYMKNELRGAKTSTDAPLEVVNCNSAFCRAMEAHLRTMEPVIVHMKSKLVEMQRHTFDLLSYFGEATERQDYDTTNIILALKKLRQAIVTSRYIVTGEQRSTSSKTLGTDRK